MVELVENLSNEGIKVQTHQRDERFGISYQLNGISFPGYKLGRAYSFPGLQKYRGINFDRAMIPEVVKAAALSQANSIKAIGPLRSLELDRGISKPSSNKLEKTPDNSPSPDLELNRAPTEPNPSITFDRLIEKQIQLERKKKQIAEKQQMKESEPKRDGTKIIKDEPTNLSKELADAIEEQTGIFETPIGKAVVNCLKLNQSRQKLEQLDREYQENPTPSKLRQTKEQSRSFNNGLIDTIASSVKIMNPQLGEIIDRSRNTAKSWNKVIELNREYFQTKDEKLQEKIKEQFITATKEFRRDYRETLASTTSLINPVLGQVLNNTLELANELDRSMDLEAAYRSNPTAENRLALENQGKKNLVNLATAYLDLGGDRFSSQFKKQARAYLNELWGIENEDEQVTPERASPKKNLDKVGQSSLAISFKLMIFQ